MMTDRQAASIARDSMRLAKAIWPMLRGKCPEMQGAVLLDLVSVFFAGHHPMIRDEAIDQWVKVMRELISSSEKEMGNPWRTTIQ